MSMSNSRPSKKQRSAISTVNGTEVQILIAKLDRAFPYLPWPTLDSVPFQELSCNSNIGSTIAENKVKSSGSKDHHSSSNISRKHEQQNRPPKHILQCESIYHHLKNAGLCQPDTFYCEVGCGTAKLSDYISSQLKGRSSHLLIDRKSFEGRNAQRIRDRAISARCHRDYNVKRLVLDLAHIECLKNTIDTCGIYLDTKQELKPVTENTYERENGQVVAISKHLCGPATDFLLRSVEKRSLVPITVATCCHYLCNMKQFSNMDFFERLGFNKRDFEVLTIVSQWASIAVKGENSRRLRLDANRNEEWLTILPSLPHLSPMLDASLSMIPSSEFEALFSRNEKAILGKRCKLIIDTARAFKLIQLGYKVKLVLYTTHSIEDHLLLALPQTK